MTFTTPRFDEIGYWSEIKLDILKEYSQAYSRIFNGKRQSALQHVYMDAFAGAGISISKRTGDFVPGSPLNALLVQPPFREFHLIDLDGDKVNTLRQVVGNDPRVHIYQGDCNDILIQDVFPRVRYEDYRRGLCLLDPYGLHLNWEVIRAAGRLGTIDLFLNFPMHDMNRNALWKNPEGVDLADIERMTRYWGDDSWRGVAYQSVQTLFGPWDVKTSNDDVVTAFRDRLKTQAGFRYVPEPLAMRNSVGAVVYYLFFASQNAAGHRIANHILGKYRP